MFTNQNIFTIILYGSFLADVHKPPVAHRDLSSFNVLVRADGTCALSDFGCSTILRSCSGPQRQTYTRDTMVRPVWSHKIVLQG